MTQAGACTVGAATAASASAPRSGVPLEQQIDPGHRIEQVGAEGQFIHELRPQPVQLHRRPRPDVGRQPAGFVRWFLAHHTDGTR